MQDCSICAGFKKRLNVKLLLEASLKEKYDSIDNIFYNKVFTKFMQSKKRIDFQEDCMINEERNAFVRKYD